VRNRAAVSKETAVAAIGICVSAKVVAVDFEEILIVTLPVRQGAKYPVAVIDESELTTVPSICPSIDTARSLVKPLPEIEIVIGPPFNKAGEIDTGATEAFKSNGELVLGPGSGLLTEMLTPVFAASFTKIEAVKWELSTNDVIVGCPFTRIIAPFTNFSPLIVIVLAKPWSTFGETPLTTGIAFNI